MRGVLRDVQRRREELGNSIRELDRLITFTTLALMKLPEEPIARAGAVRSALETILRLGTD